MPGARAGRACTEEDFEQFRSWGWRPIPQVLVATWVGGGFKCWEYWNGRHYPYGKLRFDRQGEVVVPAGIQPVDP